LSGRLRLEDEMCRYASQVKIAAVKALAKVAEKGDQHAIAALRGRLEDAKLHVRLAAVGALAKVAEKGHLHTIAAVSGHLEHADCQSDQMCGVCCGTSHLLADVCPLCEREGCLASGD